MSDILPVRPRVAVITGASGGIGRATAERLAALGASVVIGYHCNREKAEALAAALPGEGHVALRIAIEEADSIAEAVAAVEARFGAVDLLVNNGGATEVVPANDLDALTDDLFDRITRVNLRGPFAMVRAFRPLLARGEKAAVVNVSSIAARTGVGSNLAYCAAKAGLDALTIGLAKVLAPDIRVFSVSPAGVDTGFVPGRPREKLEAMAKTLPLQRITTPDDVARAIIACATLLTSSTGIVVPVDEGRHL
ncbi:MAG: short-chain dehydrogenase [Martelella sp.]|uniref:SDR family NAD(P)-dependent oxidoreductase n=1 Tax=Martelella sp. TaxID=1969699 RepID=UPI000C4CB637|nr:SDR family oxidoreductase [Martelella sp.]MAU21394.1 short-chain dehydrogenase [Martelella sp.]|tara:strand:+ start:500 stop:1252 length:753 start_codon:yes stop_codon:yes gene_type:complete